MDSHNLNQYADYLVNIFEREQKHKGERGVKVNPLVSEIASWYEKMRNAVEYRDEEVVLRAAIERILKRRLMLGGDGKAVGQMLVRELVWARYFPDGTVTQEIVEKIEQSVDFYLHLQQQVQKKHKISEGALHEFIYDLMSSHIEDILNPSEEKEGIVNFMYHILRNNITIEDDTEENRDVQVYLAILRAFAKNDIALLRFHLFRQYFADVDLKDTEVIARDFVAGYQNIENQIRYPIQHKVYSAVKRLTPPFLVLYQVLFEEKDAFRSLIKDKEKLKEKVTAICEGKYKTILSKVHRGIVRSVIFIFLTKIFIALAIEGTYESIVYGSIMWFSISLNVIIPPILMVLSALFVATPGKKNTQVIYQMIDTVLHDKDPRIGYPVILRKSPKRSKSLMHTIFSFLWLASFFSSFGAIIYILTLLHFNIVSQAVFIFFLAIVMFLVYRIRQTAREYTVMESEGLTKTIFNFFFMPFAQVGRKLAEGVAQVNVFLFILDFLIEAPFKAIVGFFEDWFFFLNEKREELG